MTYDQKSNHLGNLPPEVAEKRYVEMSTRTGSSAMVYSQYPKMIITLILRKKGIVCLSNKLKKK